MVLDGCTSFFVCSACLLLFASACLARLILLACLSCLPVVSSSSLCLPRLVCRVRLVVCCLGRNVFALRKLLSWSLSRLAHLSFVLACGFVLFPLPVSSCLPCPFGGVLSRPERVRSAKTFFLVSVFARLVLLACLSCLPVVSSCSLCLSRLASRVRLVVVCCLGRNVFALRESKDVPSLLIDQ